MQIDCMLLVMMIDFKQTTHIYIYVLPIQFQNDWPCNCTEENMHIES